MSKRCYHCKETKPLDAFGKDRSRGDGLCCKCISCCRKLQHRYYLNQKSTIQSKRKAALDMVNSIKSQRGCYFCSENNPVCLDFHHFRDKKDCVAKLVLSYNQQNILEEIKKCIVVCANCHRKLHAGIICYESSDLVPS